MSPKKKKGSKKGKKVKKKKVKAQPRRRLIPFTAGKLPSVSKAMPQAASAIPSVSKAMPQVAKAVPLVKGAIPLVSGYVPLVSNVGRVTLPVAWKLLPPREWAKTKIPVTRMRPPVIVEMRLKEFLRLLPTAPFAPLVAVKEIAEAVKEQAEEERRDPKVGLELDLLELKMRREMKKISEEDYKMEEAKLKKQIKDLEAREKVRGKAKEIKEKPKSKKKPKGRKKSK